MSETISSWKLSRMSFFPSTGTHNRSDHRHYIHPKGSETGKVDTRCSHIYTHTCTFKRGWASAPATVGTLGGVSCVPSGVWEGWEPPPEEPLLARLLPAIPAGASCSAGRSRHACVLPSTNLKDEVTYLGRCGLLTDWLISWIKVSWQSHMTIPYN